MRLIPVDKIEPNKFNPNVMSKEEFDTLCFDMKTTGPEHVLKIDDLLVSPKKIFYNDPQAEPDVYVIIDGEHRWKSAKINGWPTVPCEIQNIGEELARVLNYRRNKERGRPDPLKEAALFKWEENKGKTHDQIGKAYMVDRTTVSKRISLLNITPETWKLLKKLPHGTMTVSHLEPLATLKPNLQKEAANHIVGGVIQYGHTVTVQNVTRTADRVKREDKTRRELQSAVDKAKVPKCPKCKKYPTGIHYKGLPWVECDEDHAWNLKTGKEYRSAFEISQEAKREKPEFPRTVRSFTEVKTFRDAAEEYIKEVVPQFEKITHISIRGTLKGKEESSLDITLGNKVHFASHGVSRISVTMEPHNYRSGEKTKVFNVWPAPQSEKDVKKIHDFLKRLKEKTLLKERKP